MALNIGTELGPYKIEAELGVGGMGQVFRAVDARLGRSVAIKTSHDQFSDRFAREARAIAQLNHPHICTLYDVGPDYLVMELVEGETLAARLKKGALPIALVLRYGAQIADALAAAHAKGIVHRDLKPQNIMIAKSGVKVLDFGLARVVEDDALTASHVVMGTPAYMAPEQREGKATDARTDLYALGLVLFEMATGKRAVEEQVRPSDGMPAQLAKILDRCLALDPDERWQSARDLMAALELVAVTTSGAPSRIAKTSARRWMVLIGATAVVVAMAGAYWLRPAQPERTFHFSILPPDGTSFANAMQGGAPAVSPDGRLIAFVAEGSGGRLLWVRSMDAFDARPLPGTEGAGGPFWSPDSAWLGFVAGFTLKKVSLRGGSPQMLARAFVGAQGPLGGAWNADGRILFYGPDNVLASVSASGGDAVNVTARHVDAFDESHYGPEFLPDGRHYLFLIRSGAELQLQVCVGELGSNERRVLLSGVTKAEYAPPRAGASGQLVFVRDGKLMAQPFSAKSLTLEGTAATLAEGVAVTGGGGLGDFSVSPSGVLVYRHAEPGKQELVWFDRAGKQVGAMGDRPGNPRNSVRLSPDGKWAAFTRQGEAAQDVWIADLVSGGMSRFTLNGGRTPVWSPDGSYIAFLRGDTIYRKPVRGGGQEVPVWSGPGTLSVNDWSGDGRYLLLTRWDAKSGLAGRGVWLLSEPMAEPGKQEAVFLESSGLHGQFVPAIGPPRWVSYDLAGQVFVQTMPGSVPGKWQVSTDGGNGSRWRRDGRELYFGGATSIVAVDVDSAAVFQHGPLRPLFTFPRAIAIAISQYGLGYDVSPDGQRFLTTFPNPETSSPAINVVMNWQAELAR